MESAELYNFLGMTFHKNADEKNGEKYLKKALKISPDNCVIISNCGSFYYDNNKYDEAIEYFLRSLAIDENNAETYYKIAKCYIQKELWGEAVSYLEKAVILDEENPLFLQELARLYYKKNDMDRAKDIFEKLIIVCPDSAWNYSNLGNIYFYTDNDVEKAQFYYEKAVEIDPAYDWGLYNLANTKMLQKAYDEALDLYFRATEISNENEIFKFALAQAYYKIEQYDNAIELLEQIEQTPDVLIFLGKIYLYNKKDYNTAKKYFEKSLDIEKTNAKAYFYLSEIYYLEFDKKNAMINISQALELDSDNDKYKAMKNKIRDLKDNKNVRLQK